MPTVALIAARSALLRSPRHAWTAAIACPITGMCSRQRIATYLDHHSVPITPRTLTRIPTVCHTVSSLDDNESFMFPVSRRHGIYSVDVNAHLGTRFTCIDCGRAGVSLANGLRCMAM